MSIQTCTCAYPLTHPQVSIRVHDAGVTSDPGANSAAAGAAGGKSIRPAGPKLQALSSTLGGGGSARPNVASSVGADDIMWATAFDSWLAGTYAEYFPST